MLILKVKQNQGLTLPLEDTFFKKPQGWTILTQHPLSNFFRYLYRRFSARTCFTFRNILVPRNIEQD